LSRKHGGVGADTRNGFGESVATIELMVKSAAPPVITIQPFSTALQVGQTATFSFAATGSFPRNYQWRKDSANIPGATLATLTLNAISTASAAAYSVVVTNAIGSVTSSSASLTVNAATPPELVASEPRDMTVVQGSVVSLSVSFASGSSPFTYQWRKNGTAMAALRARLING
jgi:hypothetical protein